MRAVIVMCVIMTCVALAGCSEVRTGTLIKCKRCGKTIQDETTFKQVPFWEAGNYSVDVVRNRYCEQCANEKVPVTIRYHCCACGQVYRVEKTTMRRADLPTEDKRIIDKEEGYCCAACKVGGLVKDGIDSTGDALGKAVEGYIEGIFRGIER